MCVRCRIPLPSPPRPTLPFMSAINSNSPLLWEFASRRLPAYPLWSCLWLVVAAVFVLAGGMADAAATGLVGVNSVNSTMLGPMSPILLHRLAMLPAMMAGADTGITHLRSSNLRGSAAGTAVLRQAIMEQQKHQQQQQQPQLHDDTAYEVPDSVLLDYVKAQMLRGLGLYEAPRVRRATHDNEYHRVYEEYRRRLEEDDLLEESDDDDDERQGSAAGLQRLYTIRAMELPGINEEEGGFMNSVRFQVPESAREGLVSAKLRLRKIPPQCAVKVYKVEDGLRSLVADIQMMSDLTSRNRGGRTRRVIDLTSSMKSWLRTDDVVELQLWGSRRGCLHELPTFDVMATELSPAARGRSRRAADHKASDISMPGPYMDKIGTSTRRCKTDKDKVCCLRLLNVTIANLGWDDWIVEPRSFQAYFCQGECSYRHGRFASSHAIVQSKMSHILGRRRVPRPCCSPKKFRPLAIMYRDRDGETHFGRIPKMIVKECACH